MSKLPVDARVPLREPGSHCQAISSLPNTVKVAIRFVSSACVAFLLQTLAVASADAATAIRFADVVSVSGAELNRLDGYPLERIAVVACDLAACRPIPMQIDERDPSGAWALDSGPYPNLDSPPDVFDADDVLLFMASDAGEAVAPDKLPAAVVVLEVALVDPLSAARSWAYVLGLTGAAPRAADGYVSYDPVADRFRGARVSFGYDGGVPVYMSFNDDVAGGNVLDRLKVRATASLLWGWLRFRRDEDDLTTELVGWRAGPIRVIRHQIQSVRLGWGIRGPAFRSYTFFQRDFAELGVALRLNRPATYFFTDILIEVVLDFRNLVGWQLGIPGLAQTARVGAVDAETRRDLNRREETSFVLIGPHLSLLQSFGFSSSLQPARKHFVYRDDADPDPPEEVEGQRPGVGYALEHWGEVGPGEHSLTASSYALPPDVVVDEFVHARAVPLALAVRPLHSSP